MFKADFRAREFVSLLVESEHPVPHGEGLEAPSYRQVVMLGAEAVPALIARLSDLAPTRCATFARYCLGDLCLKVLLEVLPVDLRELLDEPVRAEYEREGGIAYFRHCASLPNRLALQRRLDAWWVANERRLRFNPQRMRFERTPPQG